MEAAVCLEQDLEPADEPVRLDEQRVHALGGQRAGRAAQRLGKVRVVEQAVRSPKRPLQCGVLGQARQRWSSLAQKAIDALDERPELVDRLQHAGEAVVLLDAREQELERGDGAVDGGGVAVEVDVGDEVEQVARLHHGESGPGCQRRTLRAVGVQVDALLADPQQPPDLRPRPLAHAGDVVGVDQDLHVDAVVLQDGERADLAHLDPRQEYGRLLGESVAAGDVDVVGHALDEPAVVDGGPDDERHHAGDRRQQEEAGDALAAREEDLHAVLPVDEAGFGFS